MQISPYFSFQQKNYILFNMYWQIKNPHLTVKNTPILQKYSQKHDPDAHE